MYKKHGDWKLNRNFEPNIFDIVLISSKRFGTSIGVTEFNIENNLRESYCIV